MEMATENDASCCSASRPCEAADHLERLRADNARLAARLFEMQGVRDKALDESEQMRTALANLIGACDNGRRIERGAGGMTMEAQLRRTIVNGVSAWAVHEARAALTKE